MIAADRCRPLINKDISRLRAVFRWAVENELLPVTVHQALQAVSGLRKNRSAAREPEPVGPVPEEVVEKTLPFLAPQVAAMVRLQLLTGARPGEIVLLRPCDIERVDGSAVWVYRPRRHKNEHHDRDRVIFFGRQAQELLRPWLDRDPEKECFSPAEVVAARNARLRSSRKSPMTPSQPARAGKSRPKRRPGTRYTRNSYRVAIQRACPKAGVPSWSPNQLRHTAATLIRSRYGLEAAQTVLGHAKADVTQVYAERDMAKARAIMAEIG
jgi:integrase